MNFPIFLKRGSGGGVVISDLKKKYCNAMATSGSGHLVAKFATNTRCSHLVAKSENNVSVPSFFLQSMGKNYQR